MADVIFPPNRISSAGASDRLSTYLRRLLTLYDTWCNIETYLKQGNPMQLTVHDVATYFNVSERTVYRWIDQKIIPAYKINDQFRFNRAELLEWATAQKINVSPEIFESQASEETPTPSMIHCSFSSKMPNCGTAMYPPSTRPALPDIPTNPPHVRVPISCPSPFFRK